jgi:Predicted membrane protein involved in D-alanine export
MLFSSLSFLFRFFPCLLFCYFIIPKKFREMRNLVLLLFSLAFYGYGGPRYLLLMLASITINYVGGLFVRDGQGEKRRGMMVLFTVLNLGMLGWFKYAGFFAFNLQSLGLPVAVPHIVLPIGISFFTFQGMSYMLDVYLGDTATQRNPLKVALYVSLFPQLIAGPIVRYTTVENEINARNENLTDFAEGGMRFLFGFAKKILLSNALGQVANAAFDVPSSTLSVAMAWLGAVSYTGQIYFDFSGYSDMAIGLGRMFGFYFLENFNYPYIASSIGDFWRRWHISLSTWFRDYVYIPLGGNRVNPKRHVFNMLLVWLLTGLWHGAAWNFVLWGVYYGLLLVGENYLWGEAWKKAPALLRHGATFALVVLGWVIFRTAGVQSVGAYFAALFGAGGNGALMDGQAEYYLRQFRWELLLAISACLPLKHWLKAQLEQRQESRLAQGVRAFAPPLLALASGGLALLYLVGSGFNPFIYFQF